MAEEWGSQPFDFDQEPRKVFINFLIYNMKQIEFQIFFTRKLSPAVKSLRGLIGSLDAKSQKTLKRLYESLVRFDATGNFQRSDVEHIYNEVCAYLHKTYLKEMWLARPKYGPDRLEVPQE